MSVDIYRVVHVFGILLLFSGLIGLWGVYSSGQAPRKGLRILLSATHGVGMLVMLISGFAMAGKLGLAENLPSWIFVKLGIWFLLGASMILAKRKSTWGFALIVLWIGLGTAAASLGILKP